jgi:hypothetical protein
MNMPLLKLDSTTEQYWISGSIEGSEYVTTWASQEGFFFM